MKLEGYELKRVINTKSDRLFDITTNRALQASKQGLESASIRSYLEKARESSLLPSSQILDIDTDDIIPWVHKDRPENELGNICDLANSIKTIGQQQPCIVRFIKESPNKYELIVGQRRWKAAELAGLKLKVVCKDLSDTEAAFIQAAEHQNRRDLSCYAKGMSYARLIEQGIIRQKDLTNILKISKQQVCRLLSYCKIPGSLVEAIQDFRKVSARTAYEINRLAHKSEDHLNALILLAEKIKSGELGANKLISEVEEIISNSTNSKNQSFKVYDDDLHLFTVRLNQGSNASILFSKHSLELIENKEINMDELSDLMRRFFKSKTKPQSPRGDKNNFTA